MFNNFDLLFTDGDVVLSPSDCFVKEFFGYSWVKFCDVESKEGMTRFIFDVIEPVNDKARKDLHELFGEFQLKITAEITHQSVNFLDVTFNLRDESYQPYRKPNNDPLFIDSRSNHPPAITKQLPTSVNMRISQLSSNQEAFSKTAPLYEAALRRSNYQADLKYSPNNSNMTRTRSRNIIWFNPPYSTNVRTNVGRNFLSLVDKHFPSSNPLHKIFNRNSVKVSSVKEEKRHIQT